MFWDLVQLVLLIVLVIVYSINLYMHNVMLRDRDEIDKVHKRMIDSLRRLVEELVEERELWYRERYLLYEDINCLMGDVLNREKERDYWRNRAISLQRELYHGDFFKEE